MVREFALAVRILRRLRGYEPQPVTPRNLWRWLRQYDYRVRYLLLRLLDSVRFVSKQEAISELCRLNERIIGRLKADGVDMSRVIYVSFDSAGSSSGVMLNMLRDRANLARRGAQLLHSRDVLSIPDVTKKLGGGAIIYVDDFVGSGKQFRRNRTHFAQFVVGSFAEYLLVVCACEEARQSALSMGVEPVAFITHEKSERPLRSESSLLSDVDRQRLIELCKSIHPQEGLGFKKLATSVVLYRNAPNTTPLLLRGSLRQSPWRGILPRYDDQP